MRSRTPSDLRPAMPSVGLRASTLPSSSRSPGMPEICRTSGMTMSVPVKMHLSPALARSTCSPRRMTSSVRGIEPAGISEAFSCTRTRCQSTNLASPGPVRSAQRFVFGHDCGRHVRLRGAE